MKLSVLIIGCCLKSHFSEWQVVEKTTTPLKWYAVIKKEIIILDFLLSIHSQYNNTCHSCEGSACQAESMKSIVLVNTLYLKTNLSFYSTTSRQLQKTLDL